MSPAAKRYTELMIERNSLLAENERLRSSAEGLQNEVERLRAENDRLGHRNIAHAEMIERLNTGMATTSAYNHNVTEQNTALRSLLAKARDCLRAAAEDCNHLQVEAACKTLSKEIDATLGAGSGEKKSEQVRKDRTE